jgi:hypothetical protein
MSKTFLKKEGKIHTHMDGKEGGHQEERHQMGAQSWKEMHEQEGSVENTS